MLSPQKKNIVLLPAVFLAVFLFYMPKADARSGCCSSHGGVSGCGCADGTPLSATCAPYYPQCNSVPTHTPPVKQYIKPTPVTPKPTTAPSNTIPSTTQSVQPIVIPVSPSTSTSTNSDNSFAGGIALGAIVAGAIGWYMNKKNKK